MKYRTGFVTNSSSTSFGAEAATVAGALLTMFASLCDNGAPQDQNDDQDQDRDDNGYLCSTVMPAGAKTIVCED